MNSETFRFEITVKARVQIRGHSFSREEFFEWLWAEFSQEEAGLIGVHEGTLLTEEAARTGLETESWTVDSAQAPRSRDWLGAQIEQRAELYFGSKPKAESARGELLSLSPSEVETLEPKDWDADWKASFLNNGEGVPIPPFWRIVPPWKEMMKEVGGPTSEQWIRINPGAGFGTGTHETTQLCLEGLGSLRGFRELLLSGPVLDFGSGSGILAVGAALLGARVDAVEIDPLAIDNARENASLNGVASQIEYFESLEEKGNTQQTYSVVFANILKPVLLEFAQQICAAKSTKGALILSGLIETDLPDVIQAYQARLGTVPKVLSKNEWRALIWENIMTWEAS